MRQTKNILILALVVINVFFLAVYGWGMYRDGTAKKQMYRQMYTLMLQNDIVLDTAGITENGEFYRLDTGRDPEAEQRLAQTLLGETETVDLGGNITAYRGEKGEAVFRTGGEFDITFELPVYRAGDNAENTSRRLLRSMSIDTADINAAESGDGLTVTAECAWMKHRIFDCRVVFEYTGEGTLTRVSGRHPENIRASGERYDMSASAAVTALARVLHAATVEQTIACRAILNVGPGYSYAAAVSGELRPVWRVETDAGILLVDAETGRVEPLIL